MTQLSKVAFLSKWAGQFADNAVRLISEADMRDFRQDIADSFFGIIDDAYTKPFPVIVTSGTNSYGGTASPAISAYLNNQEFLVKITNASSSNSVLNLNTIGSKKIFKSPTSQAASGDLIAGQIYLMIYQTSLDTAAGGFLIVSGSVGSGSGGPPFTLWAWSAHANAAPTATAEGQGWFTTEEYVDGEFVIPPWAILISKSASSNSIDPDPDVSEFIIKL